MTWYGNQNCIVYLVVRTLYISLKRLWTIATMNYLPLAIESKSIRHWLPPPITSPESPILRQFPLRIFLKRPKIQISAKIIKCLYFLWILQFQTRPDLSSFTKISTVEIIVPYSAEHFRSPTSCIIVWRRKNWCSRKRVGDRRIVTCIYSFEHCMVLRPKQFLIGKQDRSGRTEGGLYVLIALSEYLSKPYPVRRGCTKWFFGSFHICTSRRFPPESPDGYGQLE